MAMWGGGAPAEEAQRVGVVKLRFSKADLAAAAAAAAAEEAAEAAAAGGDDAFTDLSEEEDERDASPSRSLSPPAWGYGALPAQADAEEEEGFECVCGPRAAAPFGARVVCGAAPPLRRSRAAAPRRAASAPATPTTSRRRRRRRSSRSRAKS